MRKDPKKKDAPKESEFKKFAKKRAPFYLAAAALVLIFVIPEITKSDLQSHFPEDFTEEEEKVMSTLMSYSGTDGDGLSIMEAITENINEAYPNENVFDNRKTNVEIEIENIEANLYQVLLNFESYKGQLNYSWNVEVDKKEVTGNDSKGKYIVSVVEFYD